MNNQGDISSLCQFGWYDWCYFRDHGASFPFGKEVLGRVLGPARGAGNEMCQWVLKVNGQVVSRRTLRPLKTDKIHSASEERKRQIFDKIIEKRWGTAIFPLKTDPGLDFEAYEDDDEAARTVPDIEDIVDATG